MELSDNSSVPILEDFDYVIYNYINEDLNIFCDTNRSWEKVPVIFSSPERSIFSKQYEHLRDDNGTLIFPIISITQKSIKKPKSRSSIYGFNVPDGNDYKANSIFIGKEINTEKSNIRHRINNKKRNNQLNFPQKSDKIVYNLFYSKQPSTLEVSYLISIKTNYVSQMNEILSRFLTYTNNINYDIRYRNNHKFEIFLNEENSLKGSLESLEEDERFSEVEFEILLRGHIIGSNDNNDTPSVVIRESASDIIFTQEVSGQTPYNKINKFKLPLFENRGYWAPISYVAVTEIVEDTKGGYFISGIFDYVNKKERKTLVHIDKYGNVTDFNANILPESFAGKILVVGDYLYYSKIGLTSFMGNPTSTLCRININTLEFDTDFNLLTNSLVTQIKLQDNYLYLSGSFTSILGESISYFARVDKDTLLLDTSFNINATSNVNDFVFKDDNIIVAGSFGNLQSTIRRRIGMVSKIDGTLKNWNPSIEAGSTSVYKVYLIDNKLYACGRFDKVNTNGIEKTRKGVCRFNFDTDIDNEDNYNLDLDHTTTTVIGERLLFDKNYIYIIGRFNLCNGKSVNSFVRVSSLYQLSNDSYSDSFDAELTIGSTVLTTNCIINKNIDILLGGVFNKDNIDGFTILRK